jgi:hypothetical protein
MIDMYVLKGVFTTKLVNIEKTKRQNKYPKLFKFIHGLLLYLQVMADLLSGKFGMVFLRPLLCPMMCF